jgi:hypothetical protein
MPAPDDAAPSGEGPAAPPSLPAPVECARPWGQPQDAGALGDPDLREASGLVGSRRNRRILWSHNDSGDSSRPFALRIDGARIARYFLLDVMARDFEDAAAAPCPHQAGDCLWVADVGNDQLYRREVVVYVVTEPELDPEREHAPRTSGPVLRLPVRWPGAPINCEAMAVAPDGSTFFLIEKAEGETASVHRHPGPLVDGVSVELVRVGDLRVPGPVVAGARLVTGASLHPLGRRLAVRTYGGVFEYFLDPEGGLDRLDLALALSLAPAEAEFQGEAIGYGPDGDTLYTVSEDARAQGDRMLHRYTCTAER